MPAASRRWRNRLTVTSRVFAAAHPECHTLATRSLRATARPGAAHAARRTPGRQRHRTPSTSTVRVSVVSTTTRRRAASLAASLAAATDAAAAASAAADRAVRRSSARTRACTSASRYWSAGSRQPRGRARPRGPARCPAPDDRRMALVEPVTPRLLAHVDPVEVGQTEVEQHHPDRVAVPGCRGPQQLQRLPAAPGLSAATRTPASSATTSGRATSASSSTTCSTRTCARRSSSRVRPPPSPSIRNRRGRSRPTRWRPRSHRRCRRCRSRSRTASRQLPAAVVAVKACPFGGRGGRPSVIGQDRDRLSAAWCLRRGHRRAVVDHRLVGWR